jgi:hypothetical protein
MREHFVHRGAGELGEPKDHQPNRQQTSMVEARASADTRRFRRGSPEPTVLQEDFVQGFAGISE